MMNARERFDAERFQTFLAHDHHARGAVANLARRGGGDAAAFDEELHAADRVETGVEADTFVDLVHRLRTVGERYFKRDDLTINRPALVASIARLWLR